MRNLRFPKEYVIVALTKKESTREGSRMKAQDQKRANAGKNLRLCKEAI